MVELLQSLRKLAALALLVIFGTLSMGTYNCFNDGALCVPNATPSASGLCLESGGADGTSPTVWGTCGNSTGNFTHLSVTDTAPAVSSCGSGAAVATNSTDNGGHVTVGSTTSTVTCTITWHNTWTNAPDCNVIDRGPTYQPLIITSLTNTSMTFNASVSMTNDSVGWVCFFHG